MIIKKIKNIIHSKNFFKITTLLFALCTVFLSVLVSKTSYQLLPRLIGQNQNKIIHDRDSTAYSFTNPILDCEAFEQGQEAVIPRQGLYAKIDFLKKKNTIDFASIYFRDLNNGPWIGVNEKEYFLPGSLLKTPYFISFLHYSQEDPSVASKKIIITKEDVQASTEQNIKPAVVLEEGKAYTLGDIALRTIKYSDNTGLSVLMKNIPRKHLDDIYSVIGNVFSYTDSEFQIRVKDVASFFRILYNASYLNRDMSEYALKVFSETDFNDGLVAGVPHTIKVAHKFGERADPSFTFGAQNIIQMHDCGIVYYPGSPYILCVMTRGDDIKKQEKFIAEISEYFYEKVDKENKK